MSLFVLAERAVEERTAAAKAASRKAAPVLEDRPTGGEEAAPPAAVSAALKRLIDFIPTETITLFWLAVPASQSLATWLDGTKPDAPTRIDWSMFVALLALTPILLILVYLSGLASKKVSRPPVQAWPWWKALASTIAFGTWAFAVPGNPFVRQPELLMVVWVVATLVSMVLGLLDPIVEQWVRR
jgi:hypothetical protein